MRIRTASLCPGPPACHAAAAPFTPNTPLQYVPCCCLRVYYNIHVHGRHVDVTPELEEHVRGRLVPVIDMFRSPAIVESEGGVRDVDVKLM